MPLAALARRRRGVPDSHPNIAANFVAASTQYGTIADNAALSMGAGVRMSIGLWANLRSGGVTRALVMKGTSGGGLTAVEYEIRYSTATTRYSWTVCDGTSVVSREFTGITPITFGLWHYLVVTYDGTNLSVSVNALPFESIAFSTDIRDGTAPFRIGADAVAAVPFDGQIDTVGVWKRALPIDDVIALYNGGVGRAYRDLSPALAASLVAWYDMDGDLTDRVGANHLTNTNNVTFVPGKR
jgi:concanavalin A-like lectin/glucanase superfamily protein